MKSAVHLIILSALLLHASLTHAAVTLLKVSFPSSEANLTLTGVLYLPTGYSTSQTSYPAVVMMHGCSGMWSGGNPNATTSGGAPNLTNNIDKWGLHLAEQDIVALAVDSYTPRTPTGVSTTAYQQQCNSSSNPYRGAVDPYTKRAVDARDAYTYLASNPTLGTAPQTTPLNVNAAHIGILGWSQGAEATLVAVAETSRTSNTSRPTSEKVFAAAVTFYPGCGTNLGFVTSGVSTSYWRPYVDARMNMGRCDDLGFYANCKDRMDRAISVYGSTVNSGHEVVFEEYINAEHSFDNGTGQSWPTSICSNPPTQLSCPSSAGDDCALRDADIDSFAFFQAHF